MVFEFYVIHCNFRCRGKYFGVEGAMLEKGVGVEILGDDFKLSLEEVISRRTKRLGVSWDAWCNTVSRLGLAQAWLPDPGSFFYRLNDVARDDLDVCGEEISKEDFLRIERSFLIHGGDYAVWAIKEAPGQDHVTLLSRREREVLDCLNAGKSLKESASILGVSPRTVEKHRENIRKKLEGELFG